MTIAQFIAHYFSISQLNVFKNISDLSSKVSVLNYFENNYNLRIKVTKGYMAKLYRMFKSLYAK